MESFLKNLDDEIEWENGVRTRCIRDLQLEKSNVKEDFMRYLATEKQKLDKACALVKDLTDASNEREERLEKAGIWKSSRLKFNQTLLREPLPAPEPINLFIYFAGMEEQNKNWQPSDDMMMELQLAINNANDTAKCVKLIDVTKKPKLKRHLNEFAEDENVQLIYCSTESETTEIKKAIDDITEQICKPSHILLFAKEKFDKDINGIKTITVIGSDLSPFVDAMKQYWE